MNIEQSLLVYLIYTDIYQYIYIIGISIPYM